MAVADGLARCFCQWKAGTDIITMTTTVEILAVTMKKTTTTGTMMRMKGRMPMKTLVITMEMMMAMMKAMIMMVLKSLIAASRFGAG